MPQQFQIPDFEGETRARAMDRQNAMAMQSNLKTQALAQNRMGMQNQDMAKEMMDRQELESLLMQTPPEQQERVGLDFLKQRDPEKAAKLSAQYIQRFIVKGAVDPAGAAKELERATGEKIEIGKRFAKLPGDTGDKVIDLLTGEEKIVNSAAAIAEIKDDFLRHKLAVDNELAKSKLVSDAAKLEDQQAFQASRDEKMFAEKEKDRATRLKAAGISAGRADARQASVDKNRQFQQGATLSDDYRQESKNFVTVRDSYERVKVSSNNPSAAGDLSLIFSYMRMLDPTSTVREGEFANAQNSGGVPDRIKAAYNGLLSGQRLSGAMRADFVGRAHGLYKTASDQQNKVRDIYKKRARTFEIPEHLVVAEDGLSDDAAGGGLSVTAPNGKVYNFKTPEEAAKFKAAAGIK